MPINNITIKKLAKYSNDFNKTRSNKVLKNINTKGSFKNLVLKTDYIQNKKNKFNKIVNIKTKITNQKNSGRCWIFAFLNVIRYSMIKKYKLPESFEFSQNYLYFFDKLEKANFFLNYIYDNKNNINLQNKMFNYKINDLKHLFFIDSLTNDGGQWNMFVNLIEKYGIIPKTNMDDNFHSKKSSELNKFFNKFLNYSIKIIKNSKKPKSILLDELLNKCYKILVIFLGEPPKKITWEYYKQDKDKKEEFKYVENITPLTFYKKYVPYNCNDKVCLINYPCKNIPFYKVYNQELAYNIINKKGTNFINLPIEIIKDIIKKSIDNNEALWCGCDFGKYISREHGILDKDAFNYKDIFNIEFDINKCDEITYRSSSPSHAVVIKGYNLKHGKTNGYLIENSWGDESGDNGYYFMSEEWLENYMFEIVVDKNILSNKIKNVLKSKPILLPFWSIFGSLLK